MIESPLLTRIFFGTRFFPKHRNFHLWRIPAQWNKIISAKTWWPPPYAWKLFETRNFLKHRSFHLGSFSVLWETFFAKNLIPIPPFLSVNFFVHQKLSETRKGPLVTFLAVSQKTSDGNGDFPPFIQKDSDYRTFLKKQRSVTRLLILVQWDKKNRQNLDAPLLMHIILRYQNFSKTQ